MEIIPHIPPKTKTQITRPNQNRSIPKIKNPYNKQIHRLKHIHILQHKIILYNHKQILIL
jgi:hypothetical protein